MATKAQPEAPAKTAIWDALSKTDPAHTKGFKRAGGFQGTAIKPIWIIRKLTEQFGACGEGWGINEPKFETLEAAGEVLVYCTVSGWHGTPANVVWGVGGDKVVAKRQSGAFTDDEAFKKAFTDAVGNAFKFVGVGADVHMGLFEDSKYLAQVREEYAPEPQKEPEVAKRTKAPPMEGPYPSKTALWAAVRTFDRELRSCGDVDQLDALVTTDENRALIEQCERYFPFLLHGGPEAPPEYEPLYALISKLRTDLEVNEHNERWRNDARAAG